MAELIAEVINRNIRLKTMKMKHPLYAKRLHQYAEANNIMLGPTTAKWFVVPGRKYMASKDLMAVVPVDRVRCVVSTCKGQY
jgi:hypothetical protein